MQRKAVIIANESLPHHASFGGSFAKGLARRGWKVLVSTSYAPADLVVMWGVRNKVAIGQQHAAGGEVCILERGYLGDRFAMTSVSFGGGLNGRGRFVIPPGVGAERFAEMDIAVQPWGDFSTRRGPAVIMGQVLGDQSVKHVNIGNWYRTAAAGCRAAGYEVRFRPHPGARGSRDLHGMKEARGSLAEVLDGAGLVVTFNSNSGVDAVLAGRATVAMDPGSMVWDIAAHDIVPTDRLAFPDRSAWAARLAWCQYSRAEMENGFCAEAVGL
ncbi:MAG TPA: hypothetical protein VMT30_02390 [Candidatus Saccharimonadia bacterium]|nr:hypothetical protein [Candidatus Saccharimonadia bacterium]